MSANYPLKVLLSGLYFSYIALMSFSVPVNAAKAPCINPPCGSNQDIPEQALPEEEQIAGADLSVRMTVQPRRVSFGGRVTFIASVVNNGSDTAVLATLDNKNMYAYPPTSVTTSKGGCSIGSFSPSVFCSFGDMMPGERVWVNIEADARVSGMHTNRVTVSSDTVDPVQANNTALIDLEILAPPPPPEPPTKHCCACYTVDNVIASCKDVGKLHNCDYTVQPKTPKALAEYLCPDILNNVGCTSFETIFHEHGAPDGYQSGPFTSTGGLGNFTVFLDAVREACTNKSKYGWCKPKYGYTGQFCYSAENMLAIKNACDTAGLPAGCSFEFSGNQSMCFADNDTRLPYPFSAPLDLVYENGTCTLVYPQCAALVGAECAPGNRALYELWGIKDTAKCKSTSGAIKTLRCTLSGISSGVWQLVP